MTSQQIVPRPRHITVLDHLLGVLGELMITLGVLLLLFVGWQLWWTDLTSNHTQAGIARDLNKDWDAGNANKKGSTDDPPAVLQPGPGKPFALIHVPRFGSQWDPRPVLEGTTLDILEEGVGHYSETAMPGGVGNVSLAGHRVTYGRPFFQIQEMVKGDSIVLETREGWYTYKMTDSQIVSPKQVEVIAAVPNEPEAAARQRYLTLTACHPKYSARQRYIVHALYDSFQPRADGPPASLDLPAGVK